jgi:hypothetical protein
MLKGRSIVVVHGVVRQGARFVRARASTLLQRARGTR